VIRLTSAKQSNPKCGLAKKDYTGFYENSSAGNATIIAEGDPDPLQNGLPSVVIFSDQSKAESATLIAKNGRDLGGSIIFRIV
jgi:hypothetical protein